MAIKMEYKGKDVADAINLACKTLNVARENLDIEVVSTGSAGIFGLCRKKAKIVVSLKGQEVGAEEEKVGPQRSETFGLSPRKREPAARKERPAPRPKAQEARGAEEITISDAVLKTVQADLDKILELMGFGIKTSVSAERNKIRAHIIGDNLEEVVGAEGETLDGLQYIMRKLISRKFPEKIKFVLDAGDFRENRTRELEEMSLKLAEEVKQTGKTRSIPALNPAERRIVHMVLQNDNTIRSRSVGEGLFKKILIYLPGKGRRKPSRRRKSQPARA